MIEIEFSWDRDRHRLVREPEAPVSTREEQVRNSKLLHQLQSGDAELVRLARYEMAEMAYEQREWYQPVRHVPGGGMPLWMLNPTGDTYHGVREGLKALSQLTGTPAALARALADDEQIQRAAVFNEYAHRVSACESHNEGCLRPMLMSIAVMSYMNPEGDAGRVRLMRQLVREWYGVDKPRRKPEQRRAQAAHHAKNLRWLPVGWRAVWGSP